MLKSTIDQAWALLAAGRAEQALALTTPLAAELPSVDLLSVHASGLKALGRADEALAWDRRTVARFPQGRVAWHNLAATLGDLGCADEAVAAARQAFALGLDAPETWLVYARALAASGDAAAAVDAFRQTIRRNPRNPAPATELAELLWTSEADLTGALGVLRAAEAVGAPPIPLILKEAAVLRAAGQAEAAITCLTKAARARPGDTALALAAADALLRADRAEAALTAIQPALAAHASHPAVAAQLSWIQSALGRGRDALATAQAGLAASPQSQALLNALATGARLTGDPRHEALYDYDAFVMDAMIETPRGWDNLDAYLSDLAAALVRLHGARGPPTEQSLQGGSQTTFRLSGHPDPAIQAFFRAIDAPLRTYMARLGTGADPLRSRNTHGWRIAGAWSVLLRSGDFHRDHVHSEGWLSSAFYVAVPAAALAAETREGWLRLGQPPFRTEPPLTLERHLRPTPGKLVLFPSYMWHGTEPFTTDESRVTIAFDVLPA
ncbi:MAG: hypothetical protein JWQ46_2192 [Phenylobacterium sp.]|nr:hypothetical protein [Phenylobacterium sp.]